MLEALGQRRPPSCAPTSCESPPWIMTWEHGHREWLYFIKLFLIPILLILNHHLKVIHG